MSGASSASPLKHLIMTNVMPVRLHDWTGRSWLYLFAMSATIEEVIVVYAADRRISEKDVTLRMFDPQKRTIRTILLKEELSSFRQEAEVGVGKAVGGGSGSRQQEEECQVFAFVNFTTEDLTCYLTTEDYDRMEMVVPARRVM